MATSTSPALNLRATKPTEGQPPKDIVDYYLEALLDRPDSAGTHNNLANALAERGKFEEAVTHYEMALRLRPDLAGIHDNLGITLKSLGRIEQAHRAFEEAIRLKPDFAEAHLNLASLYKASEDRAKAIAHLREAVRLRPDLGRAHANLGFVLGSQGEHVEAESSYREALRLRPGDLETINNLGNTLRELGRLDESEVCYREAIRQGPSHAGAHNNLGNILADRGRFAEAQVYHDEAIRLQPDYVEARKNRSHAYLAAGDYSRGFAEYEWRLKTNELRDDPSPKPLWEGEPLDGRTILLRTEQGLGDTIQFIRYAPMVKGRGGRVLLECEPALSKLLQGVAGVDALVPFGSKPTHDFQRSLMSLPHVFGTTLGTVPAAVPYLTASNRLVERWGAELAELEGFKVGIAWQGNPKYKRDRERSIPLGWFESLAKIPGIRLIGLQKGWGGGVSETPPIRFPVESLRPGRDQTEGAFVDTAAIMKGLDLVITSDTAIAHLAGALGVPTWVALSAIPDWRWMLDRDDTPWYPTMKLFRQVKLGRWDEPFARMAAELRSRLAVMPTVEAVPVLISPGELIDKIAILEIKRERFDDPEKLRHVAAELARLVAARDRHIPTTAALTMLFAELKRVNEALWDIENGIRRCERNDSFGSDFVELARSVGRENGRRAELKRQIDILIGASIYEQKSYGDLDLDPQVTVRPNPVVARRPTQ